MHLNLPNQITLVRFVLAVVFCSLLSQYDCNRGARLDWLIDSGFIVFLVAAASDIIDGYIARRQNQVTSFGRVLDPFVDKVLICGAFVLMLGRNFVDEATGHNVTGLEAWMVTIVVCRELLVTSLRGFSEARGTHYGANVLGKIKMLVQSITVGWILVSLTSARSWQAWLHLRGWWIGATVAITAVSLLAYLVQARVILAERSRSDPQI